jgi:diadenosine tetraphosphate (Ap4A) HIT family hydrolase
MQIDPQLVVLETAYWTFSVRPQCVTLGCGVLASKTDAYDFQSLPVEDFVDLKEAFSRVANAYAATWKPDKVNYCALMMLDPSVHFHVFPRYSQARFFAGLRFDDLDWPNPPTLSRLVPMQHSQLIEVATHLRAGKHPHS